MSMREHAAVAAILGRRSIRKYTSQPVEREKIDLLLECACAAPTAQESDHGIRGGGMIGRNSMRLREHLLSGRCFFVSPSQSWLRRSRKNEFARVYWEEIVPPPWKISCGGPSSRSGERLARRPHSPVRNRRFGDPRIPERFRSRCRRHRHSRRSEGAHEE